MCGISAYWGKREANSIVLQGLQKLEYRGYDSWGIAALASGKISIEKNIGRISDAKISLPDSNTAIGHTRWATHGTVTKENAHPHTSCSGEIAIVHNGIIENYVELKLGLSAAGHKFASETDSEVIAHLAEDFVKKGLSFEDAVKKTCDSLQGTFAIIFLSTKSNMLIAVRKGSPLVIGLGAGENFAASDVTAFIDSTKRVMFLDDNEIAFIGEKVEVENFSTGKKVKKEVSKIEWDAEQAEKQGFKHFMLKEIMEQPEAIKKCLQGRVNSEEISLEELAPFKEKLEQINRVVVIACGTSWHAGLISEYFFEELCKIPTEVEYAAEFRYRNPIVDEKTLVVAISQSGETADTLAALREAKKKGSLVVSICNVMGSTIARESNVTIYTRAGPEIGVASTKAFTTQLAVLFILALKLAFLKGAVDEKKSAEVINALNEIPTKMQATLEKIDSVKAVAGEYWEKPNALYLGRGYNYPIALEGA
ncbi:MAG: glutamine--fructose-6-phosphate transaminase (isomerizing), partial [archaeon]|nr:glutamine--fructose-6-phosphate transaminase (isomerizing) [archaeon]